MYTGDFGAATGILAAIKRNPYQGLKLIQNQASEHRLA